MEEQEAHGTRPAKAWGKHPPIAQGDVPLAELLVQLAADWALQRTLARSDGELALYGPTTGAGISLVIKQCSEWTADHVRGLSQTLEACRIHAEAAGIDPFASVSISWGRDPVYVCTEWIEGTDMHVWFKETIDDLTIEDAIGTWLDASTRLGGLVAHYHQAMAASDPNRRNAPLKWAALEKSGPSVRLIRSLGGRKSFNRSERVRSIDDPGPRNTVVGPNGELRLIDLPAHLHVVTVERDIARLVRRMIPSIRKHSRSSWVPPMRYYRDAVEAVIGGYEMVGSPERRPIDRALVYASLTADAVVKAVDTIKRRRPGRRLKTFVRESLAAVSLAVRTLQLRAVRIAYDR